MILQKNINGNWIDQQVVVDEKIIVPANNLIKLNNKWNSKRVVANSIGQYRVYAKFELDDKIIETNWEFEVIAMPISSKEYAQKVYIVTDDSGSQQEWILAVGLQEWLNPATAWIFK